MARIRSIHPNISRDESFILLPVDTRVFLLGLGTYCNYADRFIWNTKAIGGALNFNNAGVHLGRLIRAGLVKREGKMGEILFAFGFSRRRISKWESLRSRVFERDDFTCTYCGEPSPDLHCDHIEPVVRGGSNDIDNLTTACATCNLSKGSKTLAEWRQ